MFARGIKHFYIIHWYREVGTDLFYFTIVNLYGCICKHLAIAHVHGAVLNKEQALVFRRRINGFLCRCAEANGDCTNKADIFFHCIHL